MKDLKSLLIVLAALFLLIQFVTVMLVKTKGIWAGF